MTKRTASPIYDRKVSDLLPGQLAVRMAVIKGYKGRRVRVSGSWFLFDHNGRKVGEVFRFRPARDWEYHVKIDGFPPSPTFPSLTKAVLAAEQVLATRQVAEPTRPTPGRRGTR